MSIEVRNETEVDIELSEFVDLAKFVFVQMGVSVDAELTILFIDPEPMEELHIRWLDLPGPTDVMSFPMDELRPAGPGDQPATGCLGDIAICPQVAAKQAAQAGHAAVEEMLLLTVHGILHLLGFDHIEDDEREEMFALQKQLLLSFLAEG